METVLGVGECRRIGAAGDWISPLLGMRIAYQAVFDGIFFLVKQ